MPPVPPLHQNVVEGACAREFPHGAPWRMAPDGTWPAFGRPQGGQARNFGRVGSPKCLLMPSCTCSCRLFFESFIRGALQRRTECQQSGGCVSRLALGLPWTLG